MFGILLRDPAMVLQDLVQVKTQIMLHVEKATGDLVFRVHDVMQEYC